MNARNPQIELYKMINTDKFIVQCECECGQRPGGNISIPSDLMMEVWRPLTTERRILTAETSWPRGDVKHTSVSQSASRTLQVLYFI